VTFNFKLLLLGRSPWNDWTGIVGNEIEVSAVREVPGDKSGTFVYRMLDGPATLSLWLLNDLGSLGG